MSDGIKFSFPILGKSRKRNLGDLQGLIDLLPEAIFLIDLESKTIFAANPNALELTGYTSREITGMELAALLPPIDPHQQALWPWQFSSTSAQAGKLIRRNLAPINVLLTSRLLNPAHKLGAVLIEIEPKGKTWVSADSSENHWKQLANLLKIIQDRTDVITRLRKVLEFGEEVSQADILAIYTTDPADITYDLSVNIGDASWMPEKLPAQHLGNPNPKNIWLPGKRSTSIFHRLALGQGVQYLSIASIGGSNAQIGFLVIAGQKEKPHPFLAQIAEMIAAAAADVISHAMFEAANQELTAQIEALIHRDQITQAHLAEGCIITTPDLLIESMNQAAEAILGYSTKEIRRQPLANILVGADPLLDILSKPPSGENQIYSGSLRIFRRQGEMFLGRVKAMAAWHDAQLQGFIVLIQDLTELEGIREQTRQLEQRAILGEITAVFAHEVRNPINNISTGLELMQLHMLPEDPNRKTIDRLMGDCDRLAELMKSVLSYSKPAEYTMTRLPLAPFLKSIVDRLRPRIERYNIKCRLEIDPDCPAVMGNPNALEQVLVNLVNNSINAMAEQGGELTIRAHKPAAIDFQLQPNAYDYVEINIIDTGPGIPPELQERIFTPFYTTNKGGTGLGLAIAKRIITAHKGSISLTSFPGGTLFRIQLPAYDESILRLTS